MEDTKKIAMLEDILDLDEGTLKPEIYLTDIEEFDSMAKLSLIVMMNDEFGKKLNRNQIKEFQTVKDILDYMG